MKRHIFASKVVTVAAGLAAGVAFAAVFSSNVRAGDRKPASSYAPVVESESFASTLERMTAAKPDVMASAGGPIKTFPLRGIKDSPPYLHDGRLLTLGDTVEFFNLVLETNLTAEEKADLVAFLRYL